MPDNVFEDLKASLQSLKDHLDANIGTIKPALALLRTMIPDQVDGLLAGLTDLLAALRTKLQALDVGGVPGLDETAELAVRIEGFLTSASPLLPYKSTVIARVADDARVIAGLPQLGSVRSDLLDLSDAILSHLETLST